MVTAIVFGSSYGAVTAQLPVLNVPEPESVTLNPRGLASGVRLVSGLMMSTAVALTLPNDAYTHRFPGAAFGLLAVPEHCGGGVAPIPTKWTLGFEASGNANDCVSETNTPPNDVVR